MRASRKLESGMFSIVVPLYNQQHLIRRTVASVFAQTFEDFELIVVDDGSTDESVSVLRACSDPRLRLIRQENAGTAAARNTGMYAGHREWIAFLDADDIWFPDHLAELARIAARFPDAGMIGTSYVEGADQNLEPPPQRQSRIRKIDYLREAARDVGVLWTSAIALRRSLALQVGDFEPFKYGEDLQYWVRMALAAPVAKSSRVTAHYFRHADSAMAQAGKPGNEPKLPRNIGELWPSAAYLERVKHASENRHLRGRIEAYQRSLVYITVVGYLARDQIEHARAVARLLERPRLDRASIAAFLLKLPKPLLRAGLSVRKWLRRKTMSFRPR